MYRCKSCSWCCDIPYHTLLAEYRLCFLKLEHVTIDDICMSWKEKEDDDVEYRYKEVDYHKYCRLCRFQDISPTMDPCNECLEVPGREWSHMPEFFEPRAGVKLPVEEKEK